MTSRIHANLTGSREDHHEHNGVPRGGQTHAVLTDRPTVSPPTRSRLYMTLPNWEGQSASCADHARGTPRSRLYARSSHPRAVHAEAGARTRRRRPLVVLRAAEARALACGTDVVMRDQAATSTHHSGLHHTAPWRGSAWWEVSSRHRLGRTADSRPCARRDGLSST